MLLRDKCADDSIYVIVYALIHCFQERQREMKKQILSKHKREEEIRRKMETEKQRQREEQKRWDI